MDINYKDHDLNKEATLQWKQTLNTLIETLIKPERLKRDLFFAILLHVMRESSFILLKEVGSPISIQDNILAQRKCTDVYEAVFVLSDFEATSLKVIACFLNDIVLINATVPQIEAAVYSTCFRVDKYILTSKIGIPMDYGNLNELFHSFKEKIIMPLKSCVLNYHRFSSGSLSGLPDDVLHHILISLPIRDVLNLSETCKRLYNVSKEECLWCRLFKRDFSSECNTGETGWKEMYRDMYVVKQALKFKHAKNLVSGSFQPSDELSNYMRNVDSRWEAIL